MHLLPKTALCGIAAALVACGGGGSDSTGTTAAAGTQAVAIQFAAVAGISNTPVDCSTAITGLGSTPTNAQLADLRFFLTNIRLVNSSGTEVPVTLTTNKWQTTSGSENAALIDFEDNTGQCNNSTSGAGTADTNTVVTGTVPAGTYVKVKATVGLPEGLNHADPMMASAPLDDTNLGWSWQTGYKFIKFEFNPVGGTTNGVTPANTYSLHIASTDCTGPNGSAVCAKKNLPQFTLNFDQATQKVALDVKELLNTTAVGTYALNAVGCMSDVSDTDCNAIFPKLGLDLATGGQAGTQTVFRVISK